MKQVAFLLEFPSPEKALAWYSSPEYAAITSIRDELAEFRMCVC
jgi:uncharacterized protein (DUF1330 family)